MINYVVSYPSTRADPAVSPPEAAPVIGHARTEIQFTPVEAFHNSSLLAEPILELLGAMSHQLNLGPSSYFYRQCTNSVYGHLLDNSRRELGLWWVLHVQINPSRRHTMADANREVSIESGRGKQPVPLPFIFFILLIADLFTFQVFALHIDVFCVFGGGGL